MGDLISRKAAMETLSLVLKGCNPELDPIHIRVLTSAIKLLEDEPAVDAAPVVHGHWKSVKAMFSNNNPYWTAKCSECGYTVATVRPRWDYCPHCGAKMDGGENDAVD